MTEHEILQELQDILNGDMAVESTHNSDYRQVMEDNSIKYVEEYATGPWLYPDAVVVQYKNLFFRAIEKDSSYTGTEYGDWEIVVPKTKTIYEPAD